MIENKYNIDLNIDYININLKRILNQTYKLLPLREEQSDWEKPLETIIEELAGMSRILNSTLFFSLLCKLEGLFTLTHEEDFLLYRRTIFECLSMMGELKDNVAK